MKFKDESGTGDNWVLLADDLLSITINEEYTVLLKTNEGTKGYCVSVTGYSALDMGYSPATIHLKSFPTKKAARVFAKKLVKLIEE